MDKYSLFYQAEIVVTATVTKNNALHPIHVMYQNKNLLLIMVIS